MPMTLDEVLRKQAERAVLLLEEKLPAAVLTGAGISVESNIPPFRGPGGLWERYDPYEYGHIDTFNEHPSRSWQMLKQIIEGSLSSKPNEAHLAIARMEKKGWIKTVITQNVDGLHGQAGSEDILEVHGNARRIYCPGCEQEERLNSDSWKDFKIKCICGSYKRPDIVFFGEELPEDSISRAFEIAYRGTDLVVVGTSGVVHPVAMIPQLAKSNGARIIEINPELSTLTENLSDTHIKASATVGMLHLEAAFQTRFS